MNCPACGADYLEGDRFCGTCGERLPQAEAPRPVMAGNGTGAAPAPATAEGGAACPVCGAALASAAGRCDVCGFEPGASVVLPGAQAAARPNAPLQPEVSARVCSVHGPLDPSWTRCPYCLREGREGRLPSGPIGSIANAPRPADPQPPAPAPAPAPEPPRPDSSPPPRMEPPEAIVPAASAQARPEAMPQTDGQSEPAASVPLPPQPPRNTNDLPRSSVGATFAIRRRPRVLAYLIEREGEAVGRVHQLEDDVTDIGRDPRNHIVLTDVLVSGFHARVERGPDGAFLVQDRRSTNGTFVNDVQVAEMRPIDEGDTLRLGNTTLVLKMVS